MVCRRMFAGERWLSASRLEILVRRLPVIGSHFRQGWFRSLELRLVAVILLSFTLPALIVGWLGNNAIIAIIRAEKIQAVSYVAGGRREELVGLFQRSNDRATAFLSGLRGECAGKDAGAVESCAVGSLASFVTSEHARGAVLRLPGLASDVTVGHPSMPIDGIEPFKPRQIVRFIDPKPGVERTYYLHIASPDGELVVSFPMDIIQRLFVSATPLGHSGETFLADGKGLFVTRPRYASDQGHSHPISARPMQDCLTTGDGEELDLDYRNVAVIHGFRRVPEMGDGCIMAHFDQAEAFAELTTLKWQFAAIAMALVGIATTLALRLGRGIVKPIAALAKVSRAIMDGDYNACAAVSGYAEIAGLSRDFNRMAERLAMTVGELREQKAMLEHRVSERTGELVAANEKLAALSRSDGLTGLANRRHLDEVLETEWRRAGRLGKPLCMILIDVDHFKRYNDHYGHLAGDDCLRRVASVLTANVQRAGELAARYGGEEFAVVLHDTELRQAAELAETIRRAVCDLALPHAGADLGVVTISLGLAVVQPDAADAVCALIDLADQALYRAKAAGRNRVVLADTDRDVTALLA